MTAKPVFAFAAFALLAAGSQHAAAQAAQATPAPAANVATIDPGMTRDQVVAVLGQPLSTRSLRSFTYLLYKNGCEKTCGMNDLVVLDSGQVVDAVFRSPVRRYTGTSSSPAMISAAAARHPDPASRPPAAVKVKPPR
jgi:hypothetical protein